MRGDIQMVKSGCVCGMLMHMLQIFKPYWDKNSHYDLAT